MGTHDMLRTKYKHKGHCTHVKPPKQPNTLKNPTIKKRYHFIYEN